MATAASEGVRMETLEETATHDEIRLPEAEENIQGGQIMIIYLFKIAFWRPRLKRTKGVEETAL